MRSKGFGDIENDIISGVVNKTEIQKLIKKYKNIKKYQKSPFYEMKKLNGNETILRDLLEE